MLLDKQVHNSVQMASRVVASSGTQVIGITHNDTGKLDRTIQEINAKHESSPPTVWFLADGEYSMCGGDFPDYDGLKALLDKCPNLMIYFDDAHGTGWLGEAAHGAIRPTWGSAAGNSSHFGSPGLEDSW